jgi:hypothetical protein
MKKLSILFFLLSPFIGFSQYNWSALQLGVQRSWHGTGDLPGFTVDMGYDHSFNRRIDLFSGITTTIHYGDIDLPTIPQDKRLHFTTAGVQLTSLIQLALLSRADHRFKIGAGPLVRFQSSSYPGIFGVTNDPNVYPEPFYTINQHGPQNTFTVGYTAAITYLPRITYRYHFGFKFQYQNDTNGDAIAGLGIVIGRFTSR